MELALKQRLTGASVLVILAVIFLPMILDGKRDDGVQRIDLTMPDAPGTTRVIRLKPAGQESDSSTPAERDEPAVISLHEEPGQKEMDRLTRDNPDKETVREVLSLTGENEPDEDSLPVETKQGLEPDNNKPAPDNKAVIESPVEGAVKQYLRLGAFSNINNVRELRSKLEKLGYQVRIDEVEVNKKALQRVRVGPFMDDKSLENAIKQIRSTFDLKPVKEMESDLDEAQSMTAEDEVVPAQIRGWAVQIGSFGNKNNASKLMEKLRKQSYPAYMESVKSNARVLWRVRVGPYPGKAEAEREMARLQKVHSDKLTLVQHP